jgi:predicted acetyltransferase
VANDDLILRTSTDEDFPAVMDLLSHAFGFDSRDEEVELEKLVFEPERNHVVADGDEIVGNAGAFSRRLTVPGGTVDAAHVTMVSVAPTYRRQGLLRRLMSGQLADVHRRGEPVAVLWASEGTIYPRFGYGLAAPRLSLEIDSSQVRLTAPPGTGRLRQARPEAVREEIVALFDRVAATRPGWSHRPGRWWDHRLADVKDLRDGHTARRALLHQGPSGVDGYALWRVKGEWGPAGPNSRVVVNEIVAETPGAYAALWRFLTTVDLTRSVTYPFASLDEPLPHLVNEPNRLGASFRDGLWLRLVDVPAALSARRYVAPVDVVIEVEDAVLAHNTGRWRLVGAAEKANCVPTGDPADLVVDVAALGAAYLGGPTLSTLAAAGRVREATPGALAAASTAFGWYRRPASIEVF